uniref:Uncharacterized protein n=1 Tax=Anguilla anguilla TaxID=7936 RepID=A0A0E9U9Z3_ANGAN
MDKQMKLYKLLCNFPVLLLVLSLSVFLILCTSVQVCATFSLFLK